MYPVDIVWISAGYFYMYADVGFVCVKFVDVIFIVYLCAIQID